MCQTSHYLDYSVSLGILNLNFGEKAFVAKIYTTFPRKNL